MAEKKFSGRQRMVVPEMSIEWDANTHSIQLRAPGNSIIRWPDRTNAQTMYCIRDASDFLEIVKLIADLYGLTIIEVKGRPKLTYVFKERRL